MDREGIRGIEVIECMCSWKDKHQGGKQNHEKSCHAYARSRARARTHTHSLSHKGVGGKKEREREREREFK
jgi:hypothetical protein